MFQTAPVIDTNDLSVPHREIWQRGVISQDRDSITLNGFDSRYPSTADHQSIGTIKRKKYNQLYRINSLLRKDSSVQRN